MTHQDVITFHWADYLVFVVCLVACAFAGVIINCLSGKKSAREMMTGKQDVPVVPVAMSVLASFMTAPFILGTTAEVYFYGAMFLVSWIGYFLGVPLVAHVFLEVFNRLNVPNPYKYFQIRFSEQVRLSAALLFIGQMLFFSGMVIYAPSLAFSVVTGFRINAVIVAVGLICTIYTAVGGLAAVIILDVVFVGVITIFLCTMAIKGSIDAGGISHVWQLASDTDRLNVVEFSPDPSIRHSFWSQTIGVAFLMIVFQVANGAVAQKLMSPKKVRDSKIIAYLSGVGFMLTILLMGLVGLIMHAYYYGCDPIIHGRVPAKDQLLPLFMMDVIGDYHGLPGFFTAGVFGASLSPVAAGLNAMGGLILVDFVMPAYVKVRGKPLPNNLMKWVAKGIAVVLGLVTIAIAYTGELFGATLLQVSLSIFSTAGGPILGMMFLGMLFPFANSWGAVSGMIVSLAIGLWILGGSVSSNVLPPILELSTNSCMIEMGNTTAAPGSQAFWMPSSFSDPGSEQEDPASSGDDVLWVYTISYMWYSLIGALISVIVGVIVSLITGFCCPTTRQEKVNPKALLRPCNCECCYCFTDGQYHFDGEYSDPKAKEEQDIDLPEYTRRNTYLEVVIDGRPPQQEAPVENGKTENGVATTPTDQSNGTVTTIDRQTEDCNGVGIDNKAFENGNARL